MTSLFYCSSIFDFVPPTTRSGFSCRVDDKKILKCLKAKCLKHVNRCILVPWTHHHRTFIQEESKPATVAKGNAAIVLVRCLASLRQQKSLVIFHCGECLLLNQIFSCKVEIPLLPLPPLLLRSSCSLDALLAVTSLRESASTGTPYSKSESAPGSRRTRDILLIDGTDS